MASGLHARAPRRYAALVALSASSVSNLGAAMMQNKAGAFVSPFACPFPFTPAELPRSIASPDWARLDLNATTRSDKYPIGGPIYLIAPEDLSTLGGFRNIVAFPSGQSCGCTTTHPCLLCNCHSSTLPREPQDMVGCLQ